MRSYVFIVLIIFPQQQRERWPKTKKG